MAVDVDVVGTTDVTLVGGGVGDDLLAGDGVAAVDDDDLAVGLLAVVATVGVAGTEEGRDGVYGVLRYRRLLQADDVGLTVIDILYGRVLRRGEDGKLVVEVAHIEREDLQRSPRRCLVSVQWAIVTNGDVAHQKRQEGYHDIAELHEHPEDEERQIDDDEERKGQACIGQHWEMSGIKVPDISNENHEDARSDVGASDGL